MYDIKARRINYYLKNYQQCVVAVDSSWSLKRGDIPSDEQRNGLIYKGLSLMHLGRSIEGLRLIRANPIKGIGAEVGLLIGEIATAAKKGCKYEMTVQY